MSRIRTREVEMAKLKVGDKVTRGGLAGVVVAVRGEHVRVAFDAAWISEFSPVLAHIVSEAEFELDAAEVAAV